MPINRPMTAKDFVERSNAFEVLGIPDGAQEVTIRLKGSDRIVEVEVLYHPTDTGSAP